MFLYISHAPAGCPARGGGPHTREIRDLDTGARQKNAWTGLHRFPFPEDKKGLVFLGGLVASILPHCQVNTNIYIQYIASNNNMMMNKLIFIASAFCVINAFKLDFKKSGKLVQNESIKSNTELCSMSVSLYTTLRV